MATVHGSVSCLSTLCGSGQAPIGVIGFVPQSYLHFYAIFQYLCFHPTVFNILTLTEKINKLSKDMAVIFLSFDFTSTLQLLLTQNSIESLFEL